MVNKSPLEMYFEKCRPDLTLIKDQIKMLKDLGNYKDHSRQVVSCGRGFAKTLLAAVVALYFADKWSTENNTPITVMIVSAQDALYRNIAMIFGKNPDLKERLKIQAVGLREIPAEGSFQFKDNGSVFVWRRATIKSVESYRADIIIYDETQEIEQSVIDKAQGCLLVDKIGMLIYIGTPYHVKKGKGNDINFFIELVKDPKMYGIGEHYHLTQHSSEVPWTAWKTWKRMWNNEHYNAECLGIVTETKEKSTFNEAWVNKCCYDTPELPEGGEKSIRIGGIDCGYHNTPLSIIERTGSKKKLLAIYLWKDKSIEDIASEIGKNINQWKLQKVQIDSRSGIHNVKYKPYIRKFTRVPILELDMSKPVEGYPSTKECMVGQSIRMFREAQLIIPMRLNYAKELVQQALKYNAETSQINDDLLDSLMIACYEPPEGQSVGGRIGGKFNITNSNLRGLMSR